MNDSPSNDPLPDGDPLWDLLGEAPEIRPSPGFCRRVLLAVPSRRRKARRTAGRATAASGWVAALFRRPLGIAAACAALLLAGLLLFFLQPGGEQPAPLAGSESKLPGGTAPAASSPVPGDPETAAGTRPATPFDPASEFEEVSQFAALVAVEDPGTLSDEELGDLFTSL